jgi:hypothetical protein
VRKSDIVFIQILVPAPIDGIVTVGASPRADQVGRLHPGATHANHAEVREHRGLTIEIAHIWQTDLALTAFGELAKVHFFLRNMMQLIQPLPSLFDSCHAK